MNSCHSCGGVIGRDCWNPQECAEITERMAIEQSQPDPAPYNANTSGLEVVAWLTTGGDVTRSEAYAKEQSVNDPDNYPSALVTAASAQARIADLEARVEYLRGSRDGHAAHAHSEFEARVAAEARADRLAKALDPFARVARWARLCGMSDLERAAANYAKRNLFWDQFSAADAALNGGADHAG